MGFQAFVLRQAMGRFRITDDIVRYLSTFQRLGETVEVAAAGRAAARSAPAPCSAPSAPGPRPSSASTGCGRTGSTASSIPRSPAFIPRGHLPVAHQRHAPQLDARRQRRLAMGGHRRPAGAGHALVRRVVARLVDRRRRPLALPVAERRRAPAARRLGARWSRPPMRVPGGDAVHRAYAVGRGRPGRRRDREPHRRRRSRSPSPCAPTTPKAWPSSSASSCTTARSPSTAGRRCCSASRPPAWRRSTFHDGDSRGRRDERAGRHRASRPLRCDAGLAQAAFLFPLPHGATLQVAIPLVPARRTRRRGPGPAPGRARCPTCPRRRVPSPTRWRGAGRAQPGGVCGSTLPDGRLAEAVEANRRFLLLFHDGDDITPGPFTYHRFWFRDAAYMLAALDRYGFHARGGRGPALLPRPPAPRRLLLQPAPGVGRQRRRPVGAGRALAAHRRPRPARRAAVDRQGRALDRAQAPHRSGGEGPGAPGPDAGRASRPSTSGPFDYFYWDAFWSLRGLLDGAALLRAVGHGRAAADRAEAWAAAMRRDLDRSLALVAEPLGTDAIPAGPRRRIDPGVIGSLVACCPLGLLPRRRSARGGHRRRRPRAVLHRPRLLPGHQPHRAGHLPHPAAGRSSSSRPATAGPSPGSSGWSTRPRRRSPGPRPSTRSSAAGAWATATTGGRPPTSCPSSAPCSSAWRWTGAPAGPVLDAARRVGRARDRGGQRPHPPRRLSFTLRWEGDEAVLRWELRPHPDLAPVRLSAPGLDPSWSSEEISGVVRLPSRPAAGAGRPMTIESVTE